MMIDRTNYETYFIDLIDGTLPGREVDIVLDFIRENPDLAEELNELERITLNPDATEEFETKALLKSDFDQPDLLTETCIRAIENNLSEEEKTAFTIYINQHSKAKNEYRLFKATISEPDLSIVYPKKNNLKKTRALAPYWYSVAAVLLIGFFFWFSNKQEELPQPIVQQTETKIEAPAIQPAQVALTPALKQEKRTIAAISKPVISENISSENIAIRTSSDEIQPLSPIQNIEIQIDETQLIAELAPVKVESVVKAGEQEIYPTIPELVAQQVSKFNLKSEASKLGKAALKRISSSTNEKLAYTTNRQGQVNKIEFNSKLLAFSIPVNSTNY